MFFHTRLMRLHRDLMGYITKNLEPNLITSSPKKVEFGKISNPKIVVRWTWSAWKPTYSASSPTHIIHDTCKWGQHPIYEWMIKKKLQRYSSSWLESADTTMIDFTVGPVTVGARKRWSNWASFFRKRLGGTEREAPAGCCNPLEFCLGVDSVALNGSPSHLKRGLLWMWQWVP